MITPRPSHIALLMVLASTSVGCGSSQPPAAAPSDVAPDAMPEPAPVDEPPPEPAAEPSPPPAPTAQEGEPDAKFREITPRECQALAGKYGELTRSDETAKLNPRLTDKQRAQAAESIDAAARTLEGRWAESCASSLLGKVAEEQAITCAMSAKNVAAFDTCLNGPK